MFKEIKSFRGRSLFVGFFLLFLFSLLLINYYKIQVIEHEKWLKIADNQHHLVVKEPFHRGRIFCQGENDKHPRCLSMDVLTFHIFINPLGIKDSIKEKMIEGLGFYFEKEKIREHFYKNSRWREIAGFISLEEKQKIENWWTSFRKEEKIASNLLTFVKDYKRSYPYDHLLGQVLSSVYKIRDEKTGKAIAISGIEKQFQEYLQGDVGKRYLMRSPKYTIDASNKHVPPKNGSDVYLTIHHGIQAICEEELKKGVENVNAKGGIALMMNPHNGKILALAQYPFFSPAKYFEYFSSKEKEEYTKPKALTDCFEPGSIIKPLTMAIALKANEEMIEREKTPIFSPFEMVRSDDFSFKGRNRPLKDIGKHKYLNMFLAIQKSSNIYPARVIEKIIDRLGPKWYSDMLRDIFGLGEKTKLELPYENPGMVPIYGKKYPNGKEQWSDPTPYSLAIGYNIMVNAVQMARAYSVFGNGGYLVQPTLIEKIVSPDGKEIAFKKQKKKRVLSGEITELICQALKYPVKAGGSAELADIPGYTEGGKTSTSEKIVKGQYSKEKHCSSFIGLAPIKNPEFVLIVILDEPEKKFIKGYGTTHFGGKSAAPIFREIGKRVLERLGVEKDDPFGFSKNDPRTIIEKSDWYNETKYINSLYDSWNKN